MHEICKHNSDFGASQCIINGDHLGARFLIAVAEFSHFDVSLLSHMGFVLHSTGCCFSTLAQLE